MEHLLKQRIAAHSESNFIIVAGDESKKSNEIINFQLGSPNSIS
jgi:hypothetical protein